MCKNQEGPVVSHLLVKLATRNSARQDFGGTKDSHTRTRNSSTLAILSTASRKVTATEIETVIANQPGSKVEFNCYGSELIHILL